jgi:FtsH-binding integral membrane protein
MFLWVGILFGLGILAFVDSIMNMGEIFRTVNSVLFMLLSLGLLVRTTSKMKEKRTEQYENRIFNLEQQIKKMESESQRARADY